jgi:hypothetical protein
MPHEHAEADPLVGNKAIIVRELLLYLEAIQIIILTSIFRTLRYTRDVRAQ